MKKINLLEKFNLLRTLDAQNYWRVEQSTRENSQSTWRVCLA